MPFYTEFTIGQPGAPIAGASTYSNPVLAGERIKAFREGMYQYSQLGENFIVNYNNGNILFFPSFGDGERIRIQSI